MQQLTKTKIVQLMRVAEYAVDSADLTLDISEYPVIHYRFTHPTDSTHGPMKKTTVADLLQEVAEVMDCIGSISKSYT